MPTKDEIIKEIYHTDFGNKQSILNDAKEKYPEAGITYNDVKAWTDTHIPRLTNLKGHNSFVPRDAKQVYEVDLFYYNFEQSEPQLHPYALICIDAFTKYVDVVPMKFKTGYEWREALETAFSKMGRPQMIYTDPDATMSSHEVKTFLNYYHVEHVITRLHASMAERATRTIKRELDKRIEKEVKTWTEYLPAVLKKYNEKMVNSSTGFTPAEATKESNYFEVKTNLEIGAVHKRKYPDIHIGDIVRVFRKRKVGEKERHGVWKPNKTVVTDIIESHGQKFYNVKDEKEPFIRGEILLLGPGEALPKAEAIPHEKTKREQKALKGLEERKKIEDTKWNELLSKITKR